MAKIREWIKSHPFLFFWTTVIALAIVAVGTIFLMYQFDTSDAQSVSYAGEEVLSLPSIPHEDGQLLTDSVGTEENRYDFNLDQEEIATLSSKLRNRFPQGACVTKKPSNPERMVKLNVTLAGKGINLKNFIVNNREYAAKCFSIKNDVLLMSGYVPMNDYNYINFIARFNSMGTIGLSYKFSAKIIDDAGKTIAKFPENGDFSEGVIGALSATIEIEGKLVAPLDGSVAVPNSETNTSLQ